MGEAYAHHTANLLIPWSSILQCSLDHVPLPARAPLQLGSPLPFSHIQVILLYITSRLWSGERLLMSMWLRNVPDSFFCFLYVTLSGSSRWLQYLGYLHDKRTFVVISFWIWLLGSREERQDGTWHILTEVIPCFVQFFLNLGTEHKMTTRGCNCTVQKEAYTGVTPPFVIRIESLNGYGAREGGVFPLEK